MYYPKVLNTNQIEILDKINLPSKLDFYLAGGTALALQLGHRTSIDFDFYSKKHFESVKLIQLLKESFPKLKVTFQAEDTLRLEIAQTEVSFFNYKYILLDKLKKYKSIKLASIKDIAVMKAVAIVQRGTMRDFVDFYYLLNKYSIKEILAFVKEKYPGYQETLVLKALVYFEDAEEEKRKRPIKILDKNFSWEKAKRVILEEVKHYQLSMIEKN